MAKTDKDGFFKLEPKPGFDFKKAKKAKDKSPKVKKIKFKKGSWKYWLYKKLNNWNPFTKNIKDFHFTKLTNYMVCTDGEKSQCIGFQKALETNNVKKLNKKYKNCAILINAYDDIFMKLSVKSYLKLSDIDKIAISKKVTCWFDGEKDDESDLLSHEDVIDNINELCYQIANHRFLIAGISEIQANACGFTDYSYKFKIVVMKTDGSVETYKGDMNDFMKAYDLKLF